MGVNGRCGYLVAVDDDDDDDGEDNDGQWMRKSGRNGDENGNIGKWSRVCMQKAAKGETGK